MACGLDFCPTCPRGRGLRDQTEHVISGDSGHRARQQGSGGLPDPQRNEQRPCLRCPLGRLRKVWMGQPQGLGSQDPWASVRVGSGSRRKELWREMSPPLELGGGAQASDLLGRGFRKEVPGVQAPEEAEKPPAGLGGKMLEGREALRVRTGSPSCCPHLPAAQDGRALAAGPEVGYVEAGRWHGQVRRWGGNPGLPSGGGSVGEGRAESFGVAAHIRGLCRPHEVTPRYLRGTEAVSGPQSKGTAELEVRVSGKRLRPQSGVCRTRHIRLFIMMPYLY